MKVIVQPWSEYESGWGNKPYGCTIHFNTNQHSAFVQNMAEKQRRRQEYSYPDGNAYFAYTIEEKCDEDILAKLLTGESFWVGNTINWVTPRSNLNKRYYK